MDILFIGGDTESARELLAMIRTEGTHSIILRDRYKAIRLLESMVFDLIIIHLGVMDFEGQGIIATQAGLDVEVIAICEDDTPVGRIRALEKGASVCPKDTEQNLFNARELILIVRCKHLRRQAHAVQEKQREYHYFDPVTCTVLNAGRRSKKLGTHEAIVFAYLDLYLGEEVALERLHLQIVRISGARVGLRSLSTIIQRLRTKIAPITNRRVDDVLQCVRGVGYKLLPL